MSQNGQVTVEPASSVFARGTGDWTGVVMIERPKRATPDSLCWVRSARTMALDGKRAIVCQLPYKMFAHYFTSLDGGDVCVYAEFKDTGGPDGGHLEFYERASKKEFFLHAADNVAALH